MGHTRAEAPSPRRTSLTRHKFEDEVTEKLEVAGAERPRHGATSKCTGRASAEPPPLSLSREVAAAPTPSRSQRLPGPHV